MMPAPSPLRLLALTSVTAFGSACFEAVAGDDEADATTMSATTDSSTGSPSSTSSSSSPSSTTSDTGNGPICGNNLTEPPEECDDGNLIDQDQCRADCTSARCGDGVTAIGWEICDDGNTDNTDECTDDCHLPRCGDGYVYAAEEDCDDGNREDGDECPSSCVFGDSTSTGDSSETSGGFSSDASSTGETDCPDPESPILLDGSCVPCDVAPDPNGACVERSADEPVCVEGRCHPCGPGNVGVCDGDRPACGSDNACVPCNFHGQCPESACHIAEGRCFSPGVVMHVDHAAETCPGTGSVALPYCDFFSALSSIPTAGAGVIILHPQPVVESVYDVAIDESRTVAILGGGTSSWFFTSDYITFRVEDATLYMDDIVIYGHGAGVYVQGSQARLYMDSVSAYNSGSSTVIAGSGARAEIRNSTFHANNNAIYVSSADPETPASVTVTYSTVATNLHAATVCQNEGRLVIRNSIVITEDQGDDSVAAVDCVDADVSYSALSTPFLGAGNVGVGHFVRDPEPGRGPYEWLQRLGDVYEPDYYRLRLTPQGANLVRDVARWSPGDPIVDVDGQQRPTTDGAPDFAGSDIPG